MTTEPQRILLVDGQTQLVQGITDELRRRGLEIQVSSDAASAFAAAWQFKPDAVVINSEFTGCDGEFLVQRIRANLQTAHLPVIVYVPRGDLAERNFLALRAQECVAPPLSAERIHAAAREHMLEPLVFTQAPAQILAHPERLAALHEMALLDSPPEESFDRLTRMAVRLLGAPTALVSLVDQDRQFFKSQVGLGEFWAAARQTRLSHSFCQWVVSGKEQVVIEDANEHAVLRSNLAIKDLGVIAYAGVPLNGRGGHVIGSFCAIESRRRAWTEDDVETLRDLGSVSEAYAVLGQARRSAEAPRSGLATLQISVYVAGKVSLGVLRILRRYGARLMDSDRNDLLAIIEEQSARLVALAPQPQ